MIGANCYEQKRVHRPSYPNAHYTQQIRHQVESRNELRWLVRRWAEDGPNRPLLVRIRSEGQLVWCIPTKAHAQHRFDPAQRGRWPYIQAFQVNQETGRWTKTRERTIGERMVVEVLGREEKVVQKARAWALAQRLGA